jgi:hypothetical protein
MVSKAPEVTDMLQGIRRTLGVDPNQKDPVLVDTLRALSESMRRDDRVTSKEITAREQMNLCSCCRHWPIPERLKPYFLFGSTGFTPRGLCSGARGDPGNRPDESGIG